jgi:hypothetical protein
MTKTQITVKASEIKRGDTLVQQAVDVTRVTYPDKHGNVRLAYAAGAILMHPDSDVAVARG